MLDPTGLIGGGSFGIVTLIGGYLVWKANSQTVVGGGAEWLVEELKDDAAEARAKLDETVAAVAALTARLDAAEARIETNAGIIRGFRRWVIALRAQLHAAGEEPALPPEGLVDHGVKFH